MLEAIALKLVTCLVGVLFNQSVAYMEDVHIDGAPEWYCKIEDKNDFYAFAYLEGGIETVDAMRSLLETKMKEHVERIIRQIISENFKDVKDPKEKLLLKKIENDDQLKIFVEQNLKIAKIKHIEAREKSLLHNYRPARTFGAAFISKQAIVDYYEIRLLELRKSITEYRAEGAFDELENSDEAELRADTQINRAFNELEDDS